MYGAFVGDKKFTLVVIKPLTQFLHKKFPQKDQTGTQRDLETSENIATNNGAETKSPGSKTSDWSHSLFPANYKSCVDLFKFVFLIMSVIFGTGSANIRKIRRKKEKHVWSAQILDELLKRASMYEYDDNGSSPPHERGRKQPSTTKGEAKQKNGNEKDEKKIPETPILIAAKNGVTEMVEKIIELFPVAVHDMDAKKKNIVLLAIENRQTYLYELLLKKKILKESIFRKVDNEGNSALHLAAKRGDYKPWLIPGEALQMHWEIKWYLDKADNDEKDLAELKVEVQKLKVDLASANSEKEALTKEVKITKGQVLEQYARGFAKAIMQARVLFGRVDPSQFDIGKDVKDGRLVDEDEIFQGGW
ncbi:alpha-latroinsectotoxin-Lt1a protein [Spatholobus suberectus]|nr:alpha-latroinsectotoxin-Lt1a protein [Spatholobus suberectus]